MIEKLKNIFSNLEPISYVLESPKFSDGVSTHIVTHMEKKPYIVEQYRIMRTNLYSAMAGKTIKTIMVTSSQKNEGKTVTACNLATALSWNSKKRTALVDADLRKPDISSTLNIPEAPGLSDIITGKLSVASMAKKPNFGDLYVIPAGTRTAQPFELLSSVKFKEVLTELKETFDYVIIDTPPTLGMADSRVIGALCDGVILIVKFGVTSKEAVKDTISSLESAKVHPIGCVLTNYQMPLYNHIKYKSYYTYAQES